jgi:hypothetical protein
VKFKGSCRVSARTECVRRTAGWLEDEFCPNEIDSTANALETGEGQREKAVLLHIRFAIAEPSAFTLFRRDK